MKKDKTKELFLEQLRKNPIVQIACEKLGVGRATFYRWKKNSKTFAKAVDEAILEGRQIVNDLAESKLVSSIQNGNLRGITYWLTNNHLQYSNKLEITGNIATTNELSAEQEADITRALSLIDLKETPNGK